MMIASIVTKPSLHSRNLSLHNAPCLLLHSRIQDSQRRLNNHALTCARGSSSKIIPRGSVFPNAMPIFSTLASVSSAASASTLPVLALPPAVLSWAFALATLHAVALVLLMALVPRAQLTTALASRAESALSPLCLLYLTLLVASWSPDTMSVLLPGSLAEGLAGGRFNPQFFPALAGVAELFSRPATAASVWVHLLVINLFAARSVWARKFLKKKCEWVPVAHSVLLAGVAAPLGLLADAATRAVCGFLEEKKPAPLSSSSSPSSSSSSAL